MTTYSVTRNVSARPEVIWDLLTDAASYPDWNPAVLRIEGEITEGERIALTSVVNPDRKFKLTVTQFDPPSKMVWADGMPLGLFKGVRTYTVEPSPDGTTEFRMVEVFSGLMEPLISKSIPDMTESFEMFGDAVKRAAEERGA